MLDKLIDKGIGVCIVVTLFIAATFLIALAFHNDPPWPITVFLLSFASFVALFAVKIAKEEVAG